MNEEECWTIGTMCGHVELRLGRYLSDLDILGTEESALISEVS